MSETAKRSEAIDAVVCLVTTPQRDARSIAATLVDKRLAACVNIVPLVQSLYWWKGKVEHDEESLLVLKTIRSALRPLEELLRDVHPYDTFELVSLDIAAGSHPYLQWIANSLGPER